MVHSGDIHAERLYHALLNICQERHVLSAKAFQHLPSKMGQDHCQGHSEHGHPRIAGVADDVIRQLLVLLFHPQIR